MNAVAEADEPGRMGGSAERPARFFADAAEFGGWLARHHDSALMAASAPATAFWAEATPSYRRVCITWVVTAKQDATRERRMRTLIDEHAHGRLIPPQRYGELPKWVARAAAAALNA
jgi:hypothetical protein